MHGIHMDGIEKKEKEGLCHHTFVESNFMENIILHLDQVGK
jgi:hypothetical protein